ncbi:Receptor homology region [Diplonema papillatum]|nr:Receptor homology region [Diplonema papillatum]KAJ9442914.1 Receptor homology region [Diplonema papillatum]
MFGSGDTDKRKQELADAAERGRRRRAEAEKGAGGRYQPGRQRRPAGFGSSTNNNDAAPAAAAAAVDGRKQLSRTIYHRRAPPPAKVDHLASTLPARASPPPAASSAAAKQHKPVAASLRAASASRQARRDASDAPVRSRVGTPRSRITGHPMDSPRTSASNQQPADERSDGRRTPSSHASVTQQPWSRVRPSTSSSAGSQRRGGSQGSRGADSGVQQRDGVRKRRATRRQGQDSGEGDRESPRGGARDGGMAMSLSLSAPSSDSAETSFVILLHPDGTAEPFAPNAGGLPAVLGSLSPELMFTMLFFDFAGFPFFPFSLPRGPVGLPPVVKERLTVAPYSHEQYTRECATNDHAFCVVCLYDAEVGDDLLLLPCTHRFHDACATPWFAEHTACPICKREVTRESVGLPSEEEVCS